MGSSGSTNVTLLPLMTYDMRLREESKEKTGCKDALFDQVRVSALDLCPL